MQLLLSVSLWFWCGRFSQRFTTEENSQDSKRKEWWPNGTRWVSKKKVYSISSLGCDSIWVEFARVFKIKFLNLISIQFFYSHEIKSVELKFLKVLNCSRLNFLNSVEDSPNIKARKMSVDLTKEKYTNHLLDLLGDVNKLLKRWHSSKKSILHSAKRFKSK